MPSFADYKETAPKWITIFESEFFPDYIDSAKTLYGVIQKRFVELVEQAEDSTDLLKRIAKEPRGIRTQLLRIFRKYVSPGTSVEMLKRQSKIPDIIEEFGNRFRSLEEVQAGLRKRSVPDEALAVLLWEYKDRGQKGYELTQQFFAWFEAKFGNEYVISGPVRAGRDVDLRKVLPGYPKKTPADIFICRKDDTPLVVGFARYDSDRGGAQEDDRPGGNREKIELLNRYADDHGVRLKILFLNDGPGLLLGSMWDDYAQMEEEGNGTVMVCTLKMLDVRLTQEWLEG